MAVTLIATAKATDANSYVTVADAETYFETRLHSAAWSSLTDEDDKARALIGATRHLDWFLIWDTATAGTPTTTTQALAWPRTNALTRDGLNYLDADTVPSFIVEATCEQALVEIGADRAADPPNRGIESVTVGPISVDFDSLQGATQYTVASAVWRLLAPWLVNEGADLPHGLQEVWLTR